MQFGAKVSLVIESDSAEQAELVINKIGELPEIIDVELEEGPEELLEDEINSEEIGVE